MKDNMEIWNLERQFKESQMRRLNMGEWKVLLGFAYRGAQNMFRISKIYDIKYPIVHRATRNLKNAGWLDVVRDELSEKNVHVRIYSLTREGLLWLFSRIPKTYHPSLVFEEADTLGLRKTLNEKYTGLVKNLKTRNDVYLHLLFEFRVDQIAENNKNLFPIIFKNWDLYKKIQVAQDLAEEFPEAAFSTLVEYYYGKPRPDKLNGLFTYNLYRAFLQRNTQGSAYLGNSTDDHELKRKRLQQSINLFKSSKTLQKLFDQISLRIEHELTNELEFIRFLRADFA